MADHEHTRRYAIPLPNGEVVTATVTPEILAIGKRVRDAIAHGDDPDPVDFERLMAWASENT